MGRSVRNMAVGLFAPEIRRREILLEQTEAQQQRLRQDLEQKGFHVAEVSDKLSVVRRRNGDRIVLFKKNLECKDSPEVPEHFFPENWERFGRKFDATRAVGQVRVKGGTGRSYMIKTISPFRPPIRTPGDTHKGNTAFTEARILLDLQEAGFSPEIPVAVVMRPGYLPTLVTRFIKGARMASWQEATELQRKLKEKGYKPMDLFRKEEQQLMVAFGQAPNVNAVTTPDNVTHPLDVEFYDVPGTVKQKRRKLQAGEYPVRVNISKQEKLSRLSGREVSNPISRYDYRLRRWKDAKDEPPVYSEYRAFVPGRKTRNGRETGEWVPVEQAPNASWRRFVVYDNASNRWVLPEDAQERTIDKNTKEIKKQPRFNAAPGRFHSYLDVEPDTGIVHEARSLVHEIFSKP